MSRSDFYANQVESEIYLDFAAEEFAAEKSLAAESLLIRALVQEIHTAAQLTAGAASAINMTLRSRPTRALSDASALIADFPVRLDNWPQRILEEELSADTLEGIAGFYAAFRHGRERLALFEVEAKQIGLGRASTLHLAPLTTSWRLTARLARMASSDVTRDAKDILPDESIANTRILDAALTRIIAGEAVCCQSDGTIIVPALSERRRAPRRSLLQTAQIRAGSSAFTAFARDVSSDGMGLTRMPKLAIGTKLMVELSCGRTFSGTIAWSDGINTGMRFDCPLRLTDPLIFG